ncbi:alpha-ketoglutarate-dependent dioxygenase AlkB family protein [Steroidobacter agaridevorans]|uniref:alpha-ketoglutarate-dependent dioxygenase AlkB family protein n=1 Tax=Steroidobacter agaridevorans TaxID=2695856 RepID=UPI001327784E|nr:alpha-ketoglutarate-dependent dioxygenase AlkB [Steroidobacter agaridevorans]GFE87182.1 alpha-ketoglutarate-dependent dioxygenase AlkB [Steroidobacter agaridevorans]
MTGDLFDNGEPRLLDLPDADIRYWPRVDLGAPLDRVLKELIEQTPWRSEVITLWGQQHPQPRLTAWFGDPGARYTYSGLALEPLPWTDLLSDVRRRVGTLADASFNSVLMNYYRDHRDSMGMHSDDEPELGRNPVIASLSLGEQRMFVLKHRFRKDLKPVNIELESGSLLLMKGATQHHWKHGINKLSRPCGPRVNLTFRQVSAGLT